MTMMNQNYQVEKLLKRLQNNTIMVNSQTEQMLPFHSGFCTVRLSLLLMLVYKLTSFEVQISTRTLLAFIVVTLCGLSQDQSWPLVATIRQYETELPKADNKQDQHHFRTGKGNQLKSHS